MNEKAKETKAVDQNTFLALLFFLSSIFLTLQCASLANIPNNRDIGNVNRAVIKAERMSIPEDGAYPYIKGSPFSDLFLRNILARHLKLVMHKTEKKILLSKK
jgi:hypothetical protein